MALQSIRLFTLALLSARAVVAMEVVLWQMFFRQDAMLRQFQQEIARLKLQLVELSRIGDLASEAPSKTDTSASGKPDDESSALEPDEVRL
jgi:hypothetical protein